MENKVNTHIAQKLAELETLPAGYAPDLESKWALLESAVNKPAAIAGRAVLVKRWSIAAALLLLVGMVGWKSWMYKQPAGMAIKNSQPATEMQQLPVAVNATAEKIKEEESAELKISRRFIKSVKKEKSESDPAPIVVIAAKHIEDTLTNNIAAPLPEMAQEKSKKKKQRYVQMDFDGGNPDNNSQNEQTSTAFFKLKLIHDNTSESGSTPENTSPLKIKYNF